MSRQGIAAIPLIVEPDKSSRWSIWRAGMIALLVLAWAVRYLAYGTEELGLDGHLSVGLALLPLPRLFDFLARDVHPPLFYLLLKAWLGLVGANYVSARWLTVAAGTLTLAVLYRVIASLAGPRGALVSVGLLVLSPALVGASATVRDFSLGLLLSVATVAIWRALDQPLGERRRWLLLVALAILTALALATWYFHLVFLLAQVVALAVNRKDWRGRLATLAAGVGVQLPWAVVALGPLLGKVSAGVTVSGEPPVAVPLQAVLTDLGTSFAGGLPTPVGAIISAAAWLLLIAWGIARADDEPGLARGWAFVAFVGLSAGLAVVYGLASRWAGASLLARYGLVILPWAALAQGWALASGSSIKPKAGSSVASAVDHGPVVNGRATLSANPMGKSRHGLTRSAKRRARREELPTMSSALPTFAVLALATVVVIGQAANYRSLERLEGFPWSRQIPAVREMELLERAGQPSDLVVFADLARAGQYALRGKGQAPEITLHVAGSDFLHDDPNSAAALLGPALAGRSRVWLQYDRPLNSASQTKLDDLLGHGRFLTREATFGFAVVDEFEAGPTLDRHAGGQRFGGVIALADWAVSPSVGPGGTVFADLRWQAVAPVDGDYTVFAHLIDSGGQTIAQHDGMPSLGNRPTSAWRPGEIVDDRFALTLPASARPGAYRLQVGLYRGNQRLKLTDGGDSVDLGPITVTLP